MEPREFPGWWTHWDTKMWIKEPYQPDTPFLYPALCVSYSWLPGFEFWQLPDRQNILQSPMNQFC